MKHKIKYYNFNTTYTWRIPKKTSLVALFGLTFLITGCYYSHIPPRDLTLDPEEALDDYQALSHLELIEKSDKSHRNLKYILLWSPEYYVPFYLSKEGNRAFIKNQCPWTSCYVTANRNLFGEDVTQFQAIVFNGRKIYNSGIDLPKARSPHQKYVFFNMESADNYPVCSSIWDGFFNLTATYKLDSDIPFPYIQIRNRMGEVIGPKRNMKWQYANSDASFDYRRNKTKAVAWFVSNCRSRSNRMEVATGLAEALKKYGWTVDIYGYCGDFRCPRFDEKYNCGSVLKKDYFFYLSFENSFSEDYVTEKLLTALQHDAVPIVLGGANYTHFLPPRSYLNAANTSSEDLAATIDKLIRSSSEYNKFFRWRNIYWYKDPSTSDSVCTLCAALHNDTFKVPTSYVNFRRWWHPNFEKRCTERSWFGFKKG